MEIKQLKEITKEDALTLRKLMLELSENATTSHEQLNKVVQSENVFLFVAVENEQIFGSISLATYNIPTGLKVWIEDVVVAQSARGKGIGRKLVQHAIDFAKTMNVAKIDLTSSFHRLPAIELYLKMGFEKRDTNLYRLYCD